MYCVNICSNIFELKKRGVLFNDYDLIEVKRKIDAASQNFKTKILKKQNISPEFFERWAYHYIKEPKILSILQATDDLAEQVLV